MLMSSGRDRERFTNVAAQRREPKRWEIRMFVQSSGDPSATMRHRRLTRLAATGAGGSLSDESTGRSATRFRIVARTSSGRLSTADCGTQFIREKKQAGSTSGISTSSVPFGIPVNAYFCCATMLVSQRPWSCFEPRNCRKSDIMAAAMHMARL
jgi:hypothetical protein